MKKMSLIKRSAKLTDSSKSVVKKIVCQTIGVKVLQRLNSGQVQVGKEKNPPKREGFYLSAKCTLLRFSQIGVWSRYRVRTFFTCCRATQVYCVAITAFLAILEDEAVITNTFFFYKVIFNSIYS